MAVFALVMGALLVVFGALALRLDLKDRRFSRSGGKRRGISQADIRAAHRRDDASALSRGVHPSQNTFNPGGGF